MGNVIPFPVSRVRPKLEEVKFDLAFYIGVRAHGLGMAYIDNPYHPYKHGDAHRFWADGWLSASLGEEQM